MAWLTDKIAGEAMGDGIFLSYSLVTMGIASSCLFRFFEGTCMTGRTVRKFVPLLSLLTFGVYLIHEQPEVREVLWGQLLQLAVFARSPLLISILFGMALLVFFSCAALEHLCQRISKLLPVKKRVDVVSDRISQKLNVLTEHAFHLMH